MARPASSKRKPAGKARGKKTARVAKAGAGKKKSLRREQPRAEIVQGKDHAFFLYVDPKDEKKECQCRVIPPVIEAQEGDRVRWYIVGSEGVLRFLSMRGEPVSFPPGEKRTKPGNPLEGTVAKKEQAGEDEKHPFELTVDDCRPLVVQDLPPVLIIKDPQP